MIGTVIKDQYQILELIGEGGMGSVYMALDLELERRVALKFLKAELGNNSVLVQRFRDELKTLAGFNHRNITVLFTSVSHQGQPVMVMELVEGETLQKMVDRRGPIPSDICVPLIGQALAGVSYAHRKKIIHRDLKPANLMLNSDGVVKVMDFGIAKIQDAPGLTRTNATIGTSLYMAPEQIRGVSADARSDIYAMGVTLYELLAGRVPFLGDSQYEIEHAHIQQTPQPPTVYYPHIPGPVVDAVMRALAKDPALRFQTADEFEAVLSGKALARTIPAPSISEPPAGLTATVEPVQTGSRAATTNVVPEREVVVPVPDAPARVGRRGGLTAALVVAALLVVTAAATWMGWPKNTAITSGPVTISGVGGGGHVNNPPVQPSDGPVRDPAIPEKPEAPSDQTPIVLSPIAKAPSPIAASPVVVPPVVVPPGGDAPSGGPKTDTQADLGYGLAGQWSGSYDRCEDNRSTRVVMILTEPARGRIGGTLSFATPDGASGRCGLNGVFVERGRKLTIRAGNCTGLTPGYLAADHESLLTFSGAELSGNVEPQEPCMTVNLRRRGK
jgi:tRNA A-37 threonylcarbamoyl transferase component Bud32